MPTFPSILPDKGCSKEQAPRVLTARFGDGYSQDIPDGINHILEKWSLSFTLRTKAVIDTIDDFLFAQGGTTAFTWVTPEGKTKKFKCKTWSVSRVHDQDNSLTCKFEESPI